MLSICTIFQNEARYLAEWIEFHRIVGVERFYLYQNRSTDTWEPVLRPYQQEGIAQVINWPMRSPAQLAAYQDCIDRRRGPQEWIAFIDCDEFLFSPTGRALSDVLAEERFEGFGAVAVNWMCFGSSGQTHFDGRPVIERFITRPADDFAGNTNMKSIVRMDRVESVGDSPHCFQVTGGTCGEAGDPVHGSFRTPASHVLLRINHYLTKSREEWLERIRRGRVDVAGCRYPYEFDLYQAQGVRDTTIQRYLPELRRRLAHPAAKAAT